MIDSTSTPVPVTSTIGLDTSGLQENLRGEHPWIPGGVFIDHPGLAVLVADFLLTVDLDALKRDRPKPVRPGLVGDFPKAPRPSQ